MKDLQIGTQRANQHYMERYLTVTIPILLVLMILGGVAAFLLYVPLLSIISVSAVMLAMVLTFVLGLQTAARLGLKSVAGVESVTKSQLRVMPRPVQSASEPEPVRANG